MADNNDFNFCNSQMKTSEETFIWKIDNFSDRQQETGKCLESGILTSYCPKGNQAKWRLQIYPNGYREEAKDYVSIFLLLVDSATTPVSAKEQFLIRDAKGEDTLQEGAGAYKNYISKNTFGSQSWGYPKFIKRDGLFKKENEYLPGDRLTIVCKVTIQEESIECGKIDAFEVPECRGMEDIGTLCEKIGKFADCTLIAKDGKQFKVYKGILACRSRYFDAMFDHEMVESTNSIVKVKDVESEVLEQMIRFIYCGTAPKLGELAEDLLIVSDKYGLDRLKLLCEKKLADSMVNGNACELLVLANRHSAKNLIAYAIKYIQLHANEVMETEGWQMLVKGNHGDVFAQLKKSIYAAAKK